MVNWYEIVCRSLIIFTLYFIKPIKREKLSVAWNQLLVWKPTSCRNILNSCDKGGTTMVDDERKVDYEEER